MALQRAADNRMIAGVCGGLAKYFGWDPTVLRTLRRLSREDGSRRVRQAAARMLQEPSSVRRR